MQITRVQRWISHLRGEATHPPLLPTVTTVLTPHTRFTKQSRVQEVQTVVHRLRMLCPYTTEDAAIVRIESPHLTFDISHAPHKSDVSQELTRAFWTVHRYSAMHSTATIVVDLSALTWSLLGRLLEFEDADILTGIDIFRSIGPPVEHVQIVSPHSMYGFGPLMTVILTVLSRKIRSRTSVVRGGERRIIL